MSLPGPNQIAPLTLKPNIHISQLIATANQKANPEVNVQEVTGHRPLYTINPCESHTKVTRIQIRTLNNYKNAHT